MKNQVPVLVLCFLLANGCSLTKTDNPSMRDSSTKPNRRAIELNDQALELFHHGKQDSALIVIDSAIQTDLDYERAYFNKCTLLWELKRNEEALTTARQAVWRPSSTGMAWFEEGLAFEHVGHLDSAMACYEKYIDYADSHKHDTLTIFQERGRIMTLTVLKGREFGSAEFEKLFMKYGNRLSGFDLQDFKGERNEIDSYQGGGHLEFFEGERRHYCYKTKMDIDELTDFLLDKGINANGLVISGEVAHLDIKDKFRNKALGLGLTECTDR